MNQNSKSIWKIRILVSSIFILGVIAGAGGFYSYSTWISPNREISRREKYQEVFNKLGLNEQQRTEVDKIIGELREKLSALRAEAQPRVQQIRAENDEKLQKVLTLEQWSKFKAEREKIKDAEKQKYKK